MGPGDLGLSLGYTTLQRDPYPPEMAEARSGYLLRAGATAFPFLEGCSPANIVARLDEGVRVIAGHDPETARIGRAHQQTHDAGCSRAFNSRPCAVRPAGVP